MSEGYDYGKMALDTTFNGDDFSNDPSIQNPDAGDAQSKEGSEETVGSDDQDTSNDKAADVNDDGTDKPLESEEDIETEENPQSELDAMKSEIAELRQLLSAKQSKQEEEEAPNQDPATQTAPNTPPVELSQEEFEKIISSPEGMAGYFNQRFSKMMEMAQKAAHDQAVRTWADQQTADRISRAFYKKNPDLSRDRDGEMLQRYMNKIIENGETDPIRALDEAGRQLRAYLKSHNVDKRGKAKTPNLSKPPADKGQKQPQTPLSPSQQALRDTFW